IPSLDPIYKGPFLNAMLRLSSKSGIYPKILVQNTVTIESSNALTGGQFGDVYKGTFQDQQVAIKILRLYGMSQHVKVGVNTSFPQQFVLNMLLENSSRNPYLATTPSHH